MWTLAALKCRTHLVRGRELVVVSFAISTKSRSISSSLLLVVERLRHWYAFLTNRTLTAASFSAVVTRQVMNNIVVDTQGRLGLGLVWRSTAFGRKHGDLLGGKVAAGSFEP